MERIKKREGKRGNEEGRAKPYDRKRRRKVSGRNRRREETRQQGRSLEEHKVRERTLDREWKERNGERDSIS